jgi:hypothetical protein
MLCTLTEDLLNVICKKLHRFTYLHYLSLTNKEINKITNKIYDFHYNKLDKYLCSLNTHFIYLSISTYLFNSRILNTKKIDKLFDNIILPDLIKILMIYNDYYNDYYNSYDNNSNYIKIISLSQYLELIKNNELEYLPFIIFTIYQKFFIFVEYNLNIKSYRLKIKSTVSNTNVGLYKNTCEYNIIKMFSLTQNELLTIYL